MHQLSNETGHTIITVLTTLALFSRKYTHDIILRVYERSMESWNIEMQVHMLIQLIIAVCKSCLQGRSPSA